METGVNLVDQQHRQIIESLNTILTSEHRVEFQEYQKLLKRFSITLMSHHEDEERIINSIDPENLDAHKRKHQILLKDIIAHIQCIRHAESAFSFFDLRNDVLKHLQQDIDFFKSQ